MTYDMNNMRVTRGVVRLAVFTVVYVVSYSTATFQSALAQQDPQQEHLSHHPELQQGDDTGGNAAGPPPVADPSGGGMMGGGMMKQMGTMMKQMNLPKPKELYPSLMEIPELPRSERIELEERAHQRMKEATAMFSEALESLSREAAGDDFKAMQSSTTKIKDAVSRFESALATHRALVEGKAPKNVALQWFKREMRLNEFEGDRSHSSNYSWLHLSAMVFLTLFFLTMIVMYFFKMRRASLLFQELLSGGSLDNAPGSDSSSNKPHKTESPVLQRSTKKWRGKLKVSRIFDETSDVKTFRLMNPLGGMLPFTFLPGQFLSVTVLSAEKPVKRGYTIASSPTQTDYVEITVKHKEGGLVSGVLHNEVKEGDLLEFSGPSGAFTFTGQECKCILLVGAGVGITPLMSVLRYLTDRSWRGDIYLVYGCKTPDDVIYQEELVYLQHRHPNLKVIITVSRPENTDWSGPVGRVDKELLETSVPEIASRYVHICGPVPMMEGIKQSLFELGIPKERIRTEAFGAALGKPEPVERLKNETDPDVSGSTVYFKSSDASAPLPANRTILEVADDVGVEIDNSCRIGTCGLCKVTLLKGNVSMEVDDALSEEEKKDGIILACQAKATDDVEVDA